MMNLEFRAAKLEEIDDSIECAIRSFGGGERLFNNIVKNDPAFDISNIRVCALNGKIVSVVNIFDRQMRIGNYKVRMGGIGSVGTIPEQRHNGYSSLVLRNCIEYMRDSGFDISILFTGIASFYAKLGWVLYPVYHLSVPLSSLSLTQKQSFNIQQFNLKSDLRQVMRIHEVFNDFRSGTLVRDEKFWKDHYTWKDIDPNLFLVAKDDQRIVAYLRGSMSTESLEIQEIGSIDASEASNSALEALFIEAIKKAQGEGKSQLNAQIPTEFSQMLEKIGLKPRRREGYWTMIKIINHHSLLSRIAPLLEERLRKSAYSDYEGSINMSYESGNVSLRIFRGEVKVSKSSKAEVRLILSQEQLLKLIFGNMNAEQIAYSNSLKLQDDHLKLIDALFPHGEFLFYRNDNF